jgi:ubiquinone/menaquinone biosynthesis C-methylase UbiE
MPGSMSSIFYKFYWAVEQRIAPGLAFSQEHYYALLKRRVPPGARWLDLGCGHQMFAAWMLPQERELAGRAGLTVGLDRDLPSLRAHRTFSLKVMADLTAVPFRSSSFDLITANMVLEHVGEPGPVLAEIRRLLKPGGLFIFNTPNSRSPYVWAATQFPERLKKKLIALLEARKAEDVFPTFYRINTPETVARLARESGFELLECRTVSSSATLVMLGPVVLLELLWLRLANTHAFRGLRTNILAVLAAPAAAPRD